MQNYMVFSLDLVLICLAVFDIWKRHLNKTLNPNIFSGENFSKGKLTVYALLFLIISNFARPVSLKFALICISFIAYGAVINYLCIVSLKKRRNALLIKQLVLLDLFIFAAGVLAIFKATGII